MFHHRSTAIVLAVLCLRFSYQPAEGASWGRSTVQPNRRAPTAANVRRDAYVRIVFDEETDFCVGRADDTAVYCSSQESRPTLCSSGSSIDFVKKFVVLEGPEGQCLGEIGGNFNGEANFDRQKILRRLPIHRQTKKKCPAYYSDGKWVELGKEPGANSLYRTPSPAPPNTVSYQRKVSPYAKVNQSEQPGLFCVGRNDSKAFYCATRPRAAPKCSGANFINFDMEIRTISRNANDLCFTNNTGYYDYLVELDSEDKFRGLPTYSKELGETCFIGTTVDGRENDSPCTSDGRRCRP